MVQFRVKNFYKNIKRTKKNKIPWEKKIKHTEKKFKHVTKD